MVRIVTDTSCDLSLEQCKKLGADDLVAITQAAYDRYLAAQ